MMYLIVNCVVLYLIYWLYVTLSLCACRSQHPEPRCNKENDTCVLEWIIHVTSPSAGRYKHLNHCCPNQDQDQDQDQDQGIIPWLYTSRKLTTQIRP